MNSEARLIAHLQMIQAVIDRMARNSFTLKGWAVALAAAGSALGASDEAFEYAPLAGLIPAVAFWGLDGYYVRQERIFRCIYDRVRQLPEPTDFSVDPQDCLDRVPGWLRSGASLTLAGLYGSVALTLGAVTLGLLVV